MMQPEHDAGPEPAEESRPWEQPGAVWRDVAPHRGELLHLLATISLACSVAGIILVLPAVVGVLLAGVTAFLAERDMDRMARGLLDPGGRAQTHWANVRAVNALGLGIVAPPLCICLWGSCFALLARFL
jgi:hypothetical protein